MRRVGLVSKELSRKGPAAPAPASAKPMKPVYGGGASARGGMISKLTVTLPDAKARKEQPVAVVTLSLRQVASRLRVPVNEVKDMLRAGTLRGNLSGVPQAELEAYIRVHRPHLIQVDPVETGAPEGFEATHLPTLRALRRGLAYRLDLWTRAVIGIFFVRKKPVLVVTLPAPPPTPLVLGPPDAEAILKALKATDVKLLKSMMEEHLDLVLAVSDPEQNSCLHLAVMAGGYERTFLLVNAGAELNLRNCDGVTPLGLVTREKKGGWKQVATLLEERGAVL